MKHNVIFTFQGHEVALTKEEAEKLIETIEEAITKSIVDPQVEAYMKVFDSFISEITRP